MSMGQTRALSVKNTFNNNSSNNFRTFKYSFGVFSLLAAGAYLSQDERLLSQKAECQEAIKA
jgi:hypothetical protein